MARTSAISLIKTGSTKAELAEISGLVIENIQAETLANALKSQVYTGDPATGSVEFKRFKNSASSAYGTARTAGHGTAITVPPTTVNLNQHKEIVEECAKFDLDTFGVANIMARRADNHVLTVAAELESAFFGAAVSAGTALTATGTTAAEKLEELIQAIETTSNNYVRGVPRNLIAVVCAPAFYGQVRSALDALPASNVDTAAEAFALYHGVRVYSSVFVPSGTDAIAMVVGSIAMPVVVYPYKQPEKIPLSNDYAVELFYDYGVAALAGDLIQTLATPAAAESGTT